MTTRSRLRNLFAYALGLGCASRHLPRRLPMTTGAGDRPVFRRKVSSFFSAADRDRNRQLKERVRLALEALEACATPAPDTVPAGDTSNTAAGAPGGHPPDAAPRNGSSQTAPISGDTGNTSAGDTALRQQAANGSHALNPAGTSAQPGEAVS